MGSFGCCFVWFIAGILLGWLLNYWLCKCSCKKSKESLNENTTPPIAKAADIPAATVEPVKPTAPEKKTEAAAPVKKASAKPKPTVKPKTTSTKPKPANAKAAPKAAMAVDLAAAKAAGIKIKSADDLTVIEGIGPKINELFKNSGLKTFTDVSSASVKEMRAILDQGGARYRMANPGTWAKQAKLAANNKWAELKKLQDELSGGKKK